MKRIILLRFHKDPDLIQNRIDILKHFNPDISIFGLFGGKREEMNEFDSLTDIEEIHYLNIEDPEIKWKNSDLCILKWYEDYGEKIDFDVVHTIEWDLVFLDKLENIYKYKDGEKHIYLTCPTALSKVKDTWFWFTKEGSTMDESNEFIRIMREKYMIENLFACLGPGTTLTREYLSGYSKLKLPEIGHDELRLPAIAQILGTNILDTNFINDWFDESSEDFYMFNCEKLEIKEDKLFQNFKSINRKAFHPVYERINIDKI